MKYVTKKIALLLGTFCVLAGYGIWSHSTAAEKPTAKGQVVFIKVAPAMRKDIPIELHALGTAVPYQSVSVNARIDSQILKVNFRDGDTVKQGDVLFMLDDRTIQAQVNQAKANLASAQAQQVSLRKEYNRNLTLIKQKAISQQALDDSKAALDAQVAAVAAAQAAMQSSEVLLDYTVIKAPIDGRTGIVNVTAGNNVKANDTIALVTINQIRPIQVRVSLPQNDFDAIRAAMAKGIVPVTAQRDGAQSKPAFGTLSHIDNAIDQGTGTFIARAVFANESEQLWPGMLVNLDITVGQDRQVLVIPEAALQSGPQGSFVFVIADNKAIQKSVTLERVQNGLALIKDGIDDGDIVATDGIMSLKDGVSVKLADKPGDKDTP